MNRNWCRYLLENSIKKKSHQNSKQRWLLLLCLAKCCQQAFHKSCGKHGGLMLRAVWAVSLVIVCVLGQDTFLTQCLSPPWTRTESLFLGQITLFQRESGLDRMEPMGNYKKRQGKISHYFSFNPSHDTPCASIYPNIQSSLPSKHVHVNRDWVWICLRQPDRIQMYWS